MKQFLFTLQPIFLPQIEYTCINRPFIIRKKGKIDHCITDSNRTLYIHGMFGLVPCKSINTRALAGLKISIYARHHHFYSNLHFQINQCQIQ